MLSIEGLADKQAALSRFVRGPLPAEASGCVQLPTDARCPRSFGNWQHVVVTSLITAHVLQARVQASSAMSCNGLLNFKMPARLLPLPARRVTPLHSANVCDQLGASLQLSSNECVSLPRSDFGQNTPFCLQRRPISNDLFGLGPHAAHGMVMDAAFALPNETMPEWRGVDELRISVHCRHFDVAHNGTEALGALEEAIRAAAAAAKSCAVLLASDRRLTLRLMNDVTRRVGCRLLTTARGAPVTDYSAEHGEDVGQVLLRDVWLLAHGHVLIGTWDSSLTELIGALIAARHREHPRLPTITYCQVELGGKCMAPLPLLTSTQNRWYMTRDVAGAPVISLEENMEQHLEWLTVDRQQRGKLSKPLQTHVGQACFVQLLQVTSKKVGSCQPGRTYGCIPPILEQQTADNAQPALTRSGPTAHRDRLPWWPHDVDCRRVSRKIRLWRPAIDVGLRLPAAEPKAKELHLRRGRSSSTVADAP